ncbi:MAG: PAP2 family protein [uncultured bacterium (gcode 4)]|uniref:PAP2 family protein n=1 Tax=uncultured bacterium (gcode 4) TaxID=1234023 RepID=K1YBF0_9BACT|nr:MAG: PAP2 family protein [uncultured bacterium (gcode 4)]
MIPYLISQDIALLNFLRSFVDPTSVFQTRLIHIFSDIEVGIVMVVLVGLWLYGVNKKNNQFKTEALMMLYSIGFAFLIYVVLNLGLPFRPRPETASAIKPLIDHLPDNSFPSGHAIFAGSSILAGFFYTRRWIAWVLLITGVMMVLSRVLAGIHYPGDILAGFIIGLLGAFVVYTWRDRECMKKMLLVYPVKIAKIFKL